MNAVVYILTDDPQSKRAQKASSLFDHPFFDVQLTSIAAPKNIQPTSAMSSAEVLQVHRVKYCLKDAAEKYPRAVVIIVKDTSISVANPETIANVVQELLQHDNWDLYYLCRWLDNCKAHSDLINLRYGTTHTARVHAPHGFQAVMIHPHARDCLLGQKPMRNGKRLKKISEPLCDAICRLLKEEALYARAVCNNLIQYDLTHARENRHYLKAAECALTKDDVVETTDSSTGFSLLWFILLIIVIVFLLWFFFFYCRTPMNEPVSDEY